ncbi:ABC transporter ATP-binding protein [Burkholderia metallica]|uniref:AAA family ATPase n=1 Tax=Burkholderia metallica TaxID=488729 RepID=UPI00158CF7BC
MKIQSLLISGFRCLGPNAVHVDLSSSLPTLVGANGSGKTTILHALAKLFGITRAQRTITRDDFHVPSGENPDVRTERSLFIEVLIGLPELADNSTTSSATVAPMFKHMVVAGPEGARTFLRYASPDRRAKLSESLLPLLSLCMCSRN